MLTLYTTQDCHLCEEAQAMLTHLGVSFNAVDIATSAVLVERYGVRIPVIELNQDELGWPFSIENLAAWLQERA